MKCRHFFSLYGAERRECLHCGAPEPGIPERHPGPPRQVPVGELEWSYEMLRRAHDQVGQPFPPGQGNLPGFEEHEVLESAKSLGTTSPKINGAVFAARGEWFFWDETWTTRHGPYPTRLAASQGLLAYQAYQTAPVRTGKELRAAIERLKKELAELEKITQQLLSFPTQ